MVIIPFDYDLQDEFIIELRDEFRYSIQYSIISNKTIEVNNPQILT